MNDGLLARNPSRCPPGVFLVGAPLGPADVDAELLGRAEHVLVELAHLDLLAGVGQDLDVEAEALHLLDEHLEALGDPRLGDVLALDDGLVDLDPAEDVVGLDGEQLLQGVGGAVGLEGPHLHLPEALAAELGLAAEGLLGDHRVGAGRAGVDLVVDQVGELQDVDVADADRVVVGLAGAAVVEGGLAVGADQPPAVAVARYRGLGLEPLEDLPDGRMAAGVVLLVPVGAVEDRRGDVHRRLRRAGLALDRSVPYPLPDRATPGVGVVAGGAVAVCQPLPSPSQPQRAAQPRWLSSTWPTFIRDGTPRGLRMMSTGVPSARKGMSSIGQDLGDDALVAVAAGQLVALGDLALLGHVDPDQLVDPGRQLVGVLPGEHPHVDDLAGLAVGHLERGVAHLAGLLTEDGPQQPLLRGQLGLALGGDLADQDVAGRRPRRRCG